ncbi:MAG: SRPBCC family protein [Pseudomonadales bacterium]
MAFDLQLCRDLFVPRELVFDAWTQEEHLIQWYSPDPAAQRDARLDPRPGGRFALAWEDVGGSSNVDAGQFVEIHRPEGFRCSLSTGAGSTDLRVDLLDLRGACRIDLRHQGFASAEQRDRREALWEALLDRLEGYFSAI